MDENDKRIEPWYVWIGPELSAVQRKQQKTQTGDWGKWRWCIVQPDRVGYDWLWPGRCRRYCSRVREGMERVAALCEWPRGRIRAIWWSSMHVATGVVTAPNPDNYTFCALSGLQCTTTLIISKWSTLQLSFINWRYYTPLFIFITCPHYHVPSLPLLSVIDMISSLYSGSWAKYNLSSW
jgi:hypothetical protein